ncbi:leucine-rich repeat LGI family member 2a isoform X1 [Chiloscyllium punctatum]|uniref:leucine-rich repeat LGI family member 2a isoform X1 n=1 Tax=Chiloscyllium punctatum TaxID=137246 RepID=UPI003B639C83
MGSLNKSLAFLSAAVGISLLSGAQLRKPGRCPARCSCTRDAVMCVGTSSVPRIAPNDIISLSLVNGSYREITEGMFSNLPFLQLLLLNSNSVTSIKDDAFAGLPHLEYLFIENNKIESISKHAFRGLRDLIHLSLANSGIRSLPRDVLSDLDSLIELDLRGNELQCDCKTKWMTTWLKSINATVTNVFCAGPPEHEGKKLIDLTPSDFDCMSTEFVLHQVLPYESISVNTFSFKDDVYVAIAEPNVGNCRVLEWSYIEMNFRSYDNITGQSIVGCKAIPIQEQVFVIVAKLFGNSVIYKYNESWTKFVKFQEINVSQISKPNDIEAFQIENEWFFIIVDSSKAGLSTIYKWSGKGFYPYQTLHEWFRDTDSEYVNIDGKSCLILTSQSQDPTIFEWNKKTKQFVQQSTMQHMEDVIAVESFRIKNDLFICLTKFIGDSKIMKWNTTHFVEVQDLPSRGSMILQPFSFNDRHYLIVGSDYTFSQIYIWDNQKKAFTKFEEMYVQAPRSFTAVSTDRMDFLIAASFKGSTQIFEHAIVDLSL